MSDSGSSSSLDQIASILRGIVDGSVDPYDGARRLWTGFHSEDPDRYPQLVTFVNDATDYEELPDRRREITQHIVEESRRLLQTWRS